MFVVIALLCVKLSLDSIPRASVSDLHFLSILWVTHTISLNSYSQIDRQADRQTGRLLSQAETETCNFVFFFLPRIHLFAQSYLCFFSSTQESKLWGAVCLKAPAGLIESSAGTQWRCGRIISTSPSLQGCCHLCVTCNRRGYEPGTRAPTPNHSCHASGARRDTERPKKKKGGETWWLLHRFCRYMAEDMHTITFCTHSLKAFCVDVNTITSCIQPLKDIA